MENSKIAERLNDCEYDNLGETIEAIIEHIDNKEIVIVYPYSDDNIEFRGAIYEELGAYGGATVNLNHKGLIQRTCEDYDCPHEAEIFNNAPYEIKQIWSDRESPWTYETNIPHAAKFKIKEDGEYFGEGLVFCMQDLRTLSLKCGHFLL